MKPDLILLIGGGDVAATMARRLLKRAEVAAVVHMAGSMLLRENPGGATTVDPLNPNDIREVLGRYSGRAAVIVLGNHNPDLEMLHGAAIQNRLAHRGRDGVYSALVETLKDLEIGVANVGDLPSSSRIFAGAVEGRSPTARELSAVKPLRGRAADLRSDTTMMLFHLDGSLTDHLHGDPVAVLRRRPAGSLAAHYVYIHGTPAVDGLSGSPVLGSALSAVARRAGLTGVFIETMHGPFWVEETGSDLGVLGGLENREFFLYGL